MNFGIDLTTTQQSSSQGQTISQGNQKPKDVVVNNVAQDKLNSRSSYHPLIIKYGVPTVYITAIVSAAATPVANGVALGFATSGNCSDSESSSSVSTPLIVAVAVSVFGALTIIGEKIFDYYVQAQEKKEQVANDLLRKEQEEKRHKELSDLLMQTLTTVQRYQVNKDQENFVKCLQAVKNIPESGSTDLKTRDEWLTTIIDMSNDELGLKTKLNSVRTLAKEIKKNEDVRPIANENPKANTNVGEGKAGTLNNFPADAVFDNLNKLNDGWKDIEKLIGFSIDSIPTDGELIDKTGNFREMSPQNNTVKDIIIDMQNQI